MLNGAHTAPTLSLFSYAPSCLFFALSVSIAETAVHTDTHHSSRVRFKSSATGMASQQPLRRLLGADEHLVGKLASEGLHTVGDIFSKTELQLVQSLDIDRAKVIKVLDFVAGRIVPELKTAGSLLRERREAGSSFFVSTGLPAIDNALQVIKIV